MVSLSLGDKEVVVETELVARVKLLRDVSLLSSMWSESYNFTVGKCISVDTEPR